MIRNLSGHGSGLMLILLLAGCTDSWLGEAEPPPLPGERIPVLAFDQKLQADASLVGQPMQLPAAVTNTSWLSAGGNPTHGGGAFELAGQPRDVWQTDIGEGVDDARPLLSVPVVQGDQVFALDTEGLLSAVNLTSGKAMWQRHAAPRELRHKADGGGLALSGDGLVIASLGYGEMVAFAVTDGKELWRTPTRSPLRSAPTVANGQAYVVTIDNQLLAFDARTGRLLWSHAGLMEAAGLLGAPSPAVSGDVVLVAYSSGELYALRTLNGGELWSDNLTATRREGGVLTLAAIRGLPVLAAGGAAAIAVSNSGRLVAIDNRSGQRVWEQRLSSQQTPWVAGDSLFVVTTDAELVALTLREGKPRWVQQLAQWENAKDKRGVISWYGPVLAGDRLWLTNSEGEMLSFDPHSGQALERQDLGTPIKRPPIVANNTLLVLNDNGRLLAWR